MKPQQPRRLDKPEPGLYAIRLVRKGPLVPVELRISDDRVWSVVINGIDQDETYPDDELDFLIASALVSGSAFEHAFVRILVFGQKLTAESYQTMLDRITWAKTHGYLDDPSLNPTKPIQLGKLKSIF